MNASLPTRRKNQNGKGLECIKSQLFFEKDKFNEFWELIFKNGYLATTMEEEFTKRKLDGKVPLPPTKSNLLPMF